MMEDATNNQKTNPSTSLGTDEGAAKTINPLVLKLQKLRKIKDTSKKIQEERIKNQNITNNN